MNEGKYSSISVHIWLRMKSIQDFLETNITQGINYTSLSTVTQTLTVKAYVSSLILKCSLSDCFYVGKVI